jgi:nickel-dependent lactate racemase
MWTRRNQVKRYQSRPTSDPDKTLSPVALGYGAAPIKFQYDPAQFAVLAPHDFDTEPLTDVELNSLLQRPVGSPLEEIVEATDQVVIVVPDATRAACIDRIAPLLLAQLNRRGLADGQISVLIGGGIHRPPTPAEVRHILGPLVAERLAVHPHDANDDSTLVRLGVTTRGTAVELNSRLLRTSHVIITGGISFHYFAGFSGGRKAILPGCAAERTIQANHLLSFDCESLEKRAGVASGRLDGNAVHEDMEEGVQMLSPSFMVNTVLNARNEIVAAYAGHWRGAHREGCERYAATHSVPVSAARPLVIVSVGGTPRDINLIQSHKAMEHASGVLEEGGTMIALAECAQGLGRDDFLDWFVDGGSRATALKLLDNYKINGQTAWGLRRKAERFRILLISSLDPAVVRKMGLEPHRSLESALAEVEPVPGYILPGGLTTLPYVSTAEPRADDSTVKMIGR